MDKKAWIEFAVICLVLIVGWIVFSTLTGVGRRSPGPQPAQPTTDGYTRPPGGDSDGTGGSDIVTLPPKPQDVVDELVDLELGNEFLQTFWTNTGAALQSLALRDYRAPYFETEKREQRPVLTLVRDFNEGYFSDVVEMVTLVSIAEGGEERWPEEVNTASVRYEVLEHTDSRIVFQASLSPKLALRKTVSILPAAHHFDVKLEFINRTDGRLRFSYRVRGPSGIERETLNSPYLTAVVGVRDGNGFDVIKATPKSLRKRNDLNRSANIAWAGLANQYFTALLQPTDGNWISQVESTLVLDTDMRLGRARWRAGEISPKLDGKRLDLARNNATVLVYSTNAELPAHGSLTRTYRFIAAPKLPPMLEPYAHGMCKALHRASVPAFTRYLSLGTVSWLSPVMLAILKFFHSVIPNYGVAILMMTMLVRLVLHPLTVKSQTSMRRMQLLQPKMAEIQKKYGDDKQKQVKEQMAMYRTYRVHPMSGCWPMFLQMPVFLALFVTLRSSLLLRQATFIPGWVSDLSQPDTIWRFPFYLPLLGNELNVLPFLMGFAWFMNQKLMPKPSDERMQQQQKIMKWMPIMFSVMMYHFASGLLLYWTFSSALGSFEHWMIRRRMAGMELKPVGEKAVRPKRGAAPAKKQGFMDRLMQHMDDQQKKQQQLKSAKPNRKRK